MPGYLGMLTVEPGRQDQQLGRRLLARPRRVASAGRGPHAHVGDLGARGADRLVPAARLALTGETKPFPYGDDRWGMPPRDDLYFVLLEKQL